MDRYLEILTISRNAAIIFLALQLMVLGVVPVFLLLKSTQGLRWLLVHLAPAMRRAQDKTDEILAIVERILGGVRAPFELGHRAADKVRSSVATVQRKLDRGGSS